DSLGNHYFFKTIIKSKYELMTIDGHLYLGIASKTGIPSTFNPFIKSYFLATVVGEYPFHGNISIEDGESAFLIYTPTSDTDGTWSKNSLSILDAAKIRNIDNYIKLNSVFIGQINSSYIPSEQQLTRSFVAYASQPGTYEG